MKSSRSHRPCVAAVALCLLPLLSYAENEALGPTPEMSEQTRWVINTVSGNHYLRDIIGELDGKEIIDAYIKSYDYSRMFYLQSEIDDFHFRFAEAMEAFLEKGNLYAAFEIFNVFRKNMEARTEWIYRFLEKETHFCAKDSFNTDREEASWPTSMEEADALWEKRIKFELIYEMLSLASESDLEKLKLPEAPARTPNMGIIEDAPEKDFDPEKLLRLLNDSEYYADILKQAKTNIRRRYEHRLRRIQQHEATEVQEACINSLTHLFDPHSSFLSADTLERFNTSVQNSFVGIGALLDNEDGICTIKGILPGGPAEASGKLKAGDEIHAVAQSEDGEFENIINKKLNYIVRKIKGKEGTTVRLLIHPEDAEPSVHREISIVRGEVKLISNLATAELIDVPNEAGNSHKVGVIYLPALFYGSIGLGDSLTTSSADIAELLERLREAGAEGIILDLRNNGGGLLTEAVRVAGLFIPTGPIVQVRDKNDRIDVLPDMDPRMLWDGPLVVLTSRQSASASEIVAGALRDHRRALIVGNSSTHGKGTVQQVFPMSNRPIFSFLSQFSAPKNTARPVASKITIKQFFLPGGTSTQLKGVPSDIVLPSSNEFRFIGESDLPHALPWDQIEPLDSLIDWTNSDVDNVNDPSLFEFLGKASEERQAKLEEFSLLKQMIEWQKVRKEKKIISIHLADRIAEKIEDEAYAKELLDKYDTMTELNYPSVEFLTKVSEEQEAISARNLSASTEAETSSEEDALEAEEEEQKPFDIHLRETARIMADWVSRLNEPQAYNQTL
ncbi:MAG: Tail-specific protease [Opitutia bacterium UBA7350]|nr:MAG: Tail-specific protease [Opitutae bacterium UBA7350]